MYDNKIFRPLRLLPRPSSAIERKLALYLCNGLYVNGNASYFIDHLYLSYLTLHQHQNIGFIPIQYDKSQINGVYVTPLGLSIAIVGPSGWD